ncbi:MAG: hypothetical protein ABIP93_11565 [Gemmatimonadaceae bacterium]
MWITTEADRGNGDSASVPQDATRSAPMANYHDSAAETANIVLMRGTTPGLGSPSGFAVYVRLAPQRMSSAHNRH